MASHLWGWWPQPYLPPPTLRDPWWPKPCLSVLTIASSASCRVPMQSKCLGNMFGINEYVVITPTPFLPFYSHPGSPIGYHDLGFVPGNWHVPELVSSSWLQLQLFRMVPHGPLHTWQLSCFLEFCLPYFSFPSVIPHTVLHVIPARTLPAVLSTCSGLSLSLKGKWWRLELGSPLISFLLYSCFHLGARGTIRHHIDASRIGILMAAGTSKISLIL